MEESRRKRIVISLDSNARTLSRKPSGVRRSRGARIFGTLVVFIVCGIVLAGVAGFFWWRHVQTTPAYSLAVLIKSFQQNQPQQIDQLVDLDALTQSLQRQVTDKATSRYGLAMNNDARNKLNALLPTLQPAMKQAVREEVVKSLQSVSERVQGKPTILVAVTLPYVLTIAASGDTVRVTIPDHNIELLMSRAQDLWRITSINDPQLVERTVDQLSAVMPPVGELVDEKQVGIPPGGGKRKRRQR